MSDEIDITTMPTDELLELMGEDLYDGYAEEVAAEVQEALSRNLTPYQVLTNGLVAGMDVVGVDFRDGVLFVPEVLMAAKSMKAGMSLLRPLLAASETQRMGKCLIGTVKGDIHDIGKNLVGMMLEGAGFDVIDLGINNDVDSYIAAIEEHQPDILGMSALLTTTMPYMRTIIEALKKKGVRQNLIVLVGGAPLNAAFAEDIEADAYCRDAAVAVETSKKFMQIRQTAQKVKK
jgi:5-methyltetrahydrofolate--homocysteine methyltransferase